jgi:hypothetical protein
MAAAVSAVEAAGAMAVVAGFSGLPTAKNENRTSPRGETAGRPKHTAEKKYSRVMAY